MRIEKRVVRNSPEWSDAIGWVVPHRLRAFLDDLLKRLEGSMVLGLKCRSDIHGSSPLSAKAELSQVRRAFASLLRVVEQAQSCEGGRVILGALPAGVTCSSRYGSELFTSPPCDDNIATSAHGASVSAERAEPTRLMRCY